MTKQQTIKDLRHWANILRQVPKGNFDMGEWQIGDQPLSLDMDGTCGTTACAGGWATTDPEFRERGLHITNRMSLCFNSKKDTLYTFFGTEAIAQFFGITLDEAYHITSSHRYKNRNPSTIIVADRIEELADKYGIIRV
jgi:hypothetical protein